MRKIAILTLVFDNYGTRLQSYALTKKLKEIVSDDTVVEVIDIEGCWSNRGIKISKLVKDIIKSYGFKSVYKIFSFASYIIESRLINRQDHTIERQSRTKLFRNFVEKIPYTSKHYSCEDVRKGLLPDYDLVLVGSDQVWNGIKVGNQDIYMLDFLKGKKGITYAASFGMTSIPQEMLPDYKKRINNFTSLLIREKEGVELCEKIGRNDAKFVLDPTLLLKKDDYIPIISKDNLVDSDYILVYSLNFSYKIFDEAFKLAKKNNAKMVVLKRSFCPPNVSKYKESVELYAVSVEGFLNLVNNAKCIVTNSYHALLFSINFNRNFYLYLDNADEENSRLLSIVNICNLEGYVYWETGSLPTQISNIDYKGVNSILDEYREQSIELLKKSIEDYSNL